MSFVGHVDWYFQVTVCARDTCGIAIVAAPVAPAASKNLRRVAAFFSVFVVLGIALPGFVSLRHDESYRRAAMLALTSDMTLYSNVIRVSLAGIPAFHKSCLEAGNPSFTVPTASPNDRGLQD